MFTSRDVDQLSGLRRDFSLAVPDLIGVLLYLYALTNMTELLVLRTVTLFINITGIFWDRFRRTRRVSRKTEPVLRRWLAIGVCTYNA